MTNRLPCYLDLHLLCFSTHLLRILLKLLHAYLHFFVAWDYIMIMSQEHVRFSAEHHYL